MADITAADSAKAVSGTSGNDVIVVNTYDHNQTPLNGFRTFSGGLGDDYYWVDNSVKVIEKPGEGIDVISTVSNYKLPDNVEGLFFGNYAGFGNDTANTIGGSRDANLLDGGKGDDYLIGGGGADTYQFGAQSGHDTIADWNAQSTIRIGGYTQFHSLSDVTKAMTQVGSDVVLKFDAADDVTIKNAKIADFTASNFQYTLKTSNLHLSFSDDFNSLSVKQPSQGKNGVWSLWGHDSDALSDHTLLGNGEKQIYVDPSFKGTGKQALGLNPYSVQDGVLNITASPIAADKQAATYNYKYQSGAISTDQTFSQTYGYFEARLQLPAEKGTWPAFWLMREDRVWPPELDIMEAWNDTTAVQTLHTQQGGWHETTSARTWLPDGDTAFHNYGLMWTAEKLTWYLDGVEVFSQPTPADMNSPMYMIVNLAVSGQVQDPNLNETLKVDYVRAYSLENLPAGVAPVSPDAAIAVPTAATDAAHTYYGAVEGMPDGLNSAYYLAHNPDVAAAFGNDALTHYLNYGRAEGRQAFDSSVVETPTSPVVTPAPAPVIVTPPAATTPATSVVNNPAPTTPVTIEPVADHVYWGKNEGVKDGFNAAYYASHNPDVVAVFGSDESGLLYHFETYGKKEGRSPYDSTVLATTPTTPVVNNPAPTTPVTIEPVPDHAYWGKNEGVKDGFNANYYASHNPDVVAVFGNDESGLLYHFETYGKKEGRLAFDLTDIETATHHAYWGKNEGVKDGFNANYYASHNPDVVAVFGNDSGNLLYHFETYGKKEGRLAYESAQTFLMTAASTADIVDLHDASASAFHTEVHMVEPVSLLGVSSPDQHYGLAA